MEITPDLAPLSATEVKRLIDEGASVIDTRPALAFAAGHIPGSYSVPLRDDFASWVPSIVPPGSPLIIVAISRGIHYEIVRQLVAVGYNNLAGFMEGGISAWGGEAGFAVASMEVFAVSELRERLRSADPPMVLDVRSDAEWKQGHIPGALHVGASNLHEQARRLPADHPMVVYSATDNRAATALSILEQEGFKGLSLVLGGWGAWQKARYGVERAEQRRQTKSANDG